MQQGYVWKNQIDVLEDWLKKKNFSVLYKPKINDEINFSDNTVLLNSKNPPERRFYILLHECGHFLRRKHKSYYRDTSPISLAENGTASKQTIKYKSSTMMDECHAWILGKDLADKLHLYYNNESINTFMHSCLKSYMKYLSKNI